MRVKSFLLLAVLVVASKAIDVDPFRQTDTADFINEMLDTILVERAPGSDGHEDVFQFITNEIGALGHWQVERDEFIKKNTTYGEVTFKNIIATLQSSPSVSHYMTLACHYDSKFIIEFVFLGASDAAVPCAMLLEIAKFLNEKHSKEPSSDVGFKLMFFDGEEALHDWSDVDSLHGSRHLANKLSTDVNGVSPLKEIDLLVLLDLIGPKNPKFWDFFNNTHLYFRQLVKIEDELTELGFLPNHERYFQTEKPDFYSEDDHTPFVEKGVPVLHLINMPFPKEWHTADDNRGIIDMNSVEHIVYILKIFAWQYMKGDLKAAAAAALEVPAPSAVPTPPVPSSVPTPAVPSADPTPPAPSAKPTTTTTFG